MHAQISFQKNNRYTDGLDDDDDTTIQVANRQLRHIPLVYVLLRMLGTVRLLLSANISNFNDGAVAPWLCLLQVSSSITCSAVSLESGEEITKKCFMYNLMILSDEHAHLFCLCHNVLITQYSGLYLMYTIF